MILLQLFITFALADANNQYSYISAYPIFTPGICNLDMIPNPDVPGVSCLIHVPKIVGRDCVYQVTCREVYE
jgi:hypothetical protein